MVQAGGVYGHDDDYVDEDTGPGGANLGGDVELTPEGMVSSRVVPADHAAPPPPVCVWGGGAYVCVRAGACARPPPSSLCPYTPLPLCPSAPLLPVYTPPSWPSSSMRARQAIYLAVAASPGRGRGCAVCGPGLTVAAHCAHPHRPALCPLRATQRNAPRRRPWIASAI